MSEPLKELAPRAPKKGRSPSYPAIPLEEAIEKARAIYKIERNHAAPVQALMADLGYTAKSGSGLVALAALKKFGLLDDVGSGDDRKASLTYLALRIIQDDREHSPEREEAIREAALKPSIHNELHDKYGSRLPSDENIRHHLLRVRGFTETGATDLIRQFRLTMDFANFREGVIITPNNDPNTGGTSGEATLAMRLSVPTPNPPSPHMEGKRMSVGVQAETRTLTVPISGGRIVFVEAPVVFSSADYELFKAILKAMKQGIINEQSVVPAADPENQKN